MDFELGPIRPPAEANSLCIRTTRGCTWNKCHFCEHYEGMPFSIRSIEEIEKDIINAAEYYRNIDFKSCFLQDGDSFVMKTPNMIKVLELIKKHFPTISQVSSYGYPSTIARKSLTEMKEIKDAGLTRLYCGMESGSDIVLKSVEKGVTAKEIIEAGILAKSSGIEISEFIIIGLGGKELSSENALETARVLNEIDPDYIRARSIGVKDNTKLGESMRSGDYILQSEGELMEEQQLLIESLDGISSYYTNDHVINLLMNVEGAINKDKAKMLSSLGEFLQLCESDKEIFTFGKRFGLYNSVEHFQKTPNLKPEVVRKINLVKGAYRSMDTNQIYNMFRQRFM